MNTSLTSTSPGRSAVMRYWASVRFGEVVVLQGSALLGAVFAFGHPAVDQIGPVALLIAANVALVAHVFVLNDWANLTTDRVDPCRAAGVFTANGVASTEMAGLAAGLLSLSLVLFSALGPCVVAVAAGIAAVSALYSLPAFNWKGRPLLSSVAHIVGGVLHFLLGYSVALPIDGRSIALGAFFGLTFAAGHLTQELRDYDADVANTIRTNAARFGRRRTLMASLTLFTLSQLLLAVLAIVGTAPRALAAILFVSPLQIRWSLQARAENLTPASVARLQTRYRTLYAVIGLAMVATLWLARP